MSRLATRVARLENHLRMGESSQAVVCWIGPDGVPEDLPEHLDWLCAGDLSPEEVRVA